MSAPASVSSLAGWVKNGLDTTPEGSLYDALGCQPGEADAELAFRLVDLLHAERLKILMQEQGEESAPYSEEPPSSTSTADSSYLGQLGLGEEGSSLAQLNDTRTLLAVIHAGTLRQRRAAIRILGDVISAGKGISGAHAKAATAAISELRDVEVAYERLHALAKLSGGAGRMARADLERMNRERRQVSNAISRFWATPAQQEPFRLLAADQRVETLTYCRDMPDLWITHLAAVLEGTDGTSDMNDRIELLDSLRYAADWRLVPSLRALLQENHPQLVTHAAHALGRIDDPRVQPTLIQAFPRAVHETAKSAVAGALGSHGDHRGAKYVRALTQSADPATLVAAADALQTLGEPDDLSLLSPYLDHDDPRVVIAAIQTLGRIGDSRALVTLTRVHTQTTISAFRAHAQDSAQAIRHRLELRGEEMGDNFEFPTELESEREDDEATTRFLIRMRSGKDYFMGILWLLMGSLKRAVKRFEIAAAQRPNWALPLISLGNALHRRAQYGRALGAYRRALETNRLRVERNPNTISHVARTFLMRADELQRGGRADIALGLLEEALTFDLRRAKSSMRFDLQRRFDQLGRTQ